MLLSHRRFLPSQSHKKEGKCFAMLRYSLEIRHTQVVWEKRRFSQMMMAVFDGDFAATLLIVIELPNGSTWE